MSWTPPRPLARPLRAGVRVGAALLAAGTLAACGGEQPLAPYLEPDAVPDIRGEDDPDDPYVGYYDEFFAEDVTAYSDQEVTLAAAVADVIAPQAFTITGPEGQDVEPLLVIVRDEIPGLEAGVPVVIAAVPQDDFRLAPVEGALGTDLPDSDFEQFEGEPYLIGQIVEVTDVLR